VVMNTLQEITLHLPADVYARLLHTAAYRRQSPEAVASEVLELTLPDAVAQADMQLNREIERLRPLGEEQIQASTKAHLSSANQQRLSELMEQNRERKLTTEEKAEIEVLFDKKTRVSG
jgi:hypothetical protein